MTDRSPHLPPPAVVDWLLAKRWSPEMGIIHLVYPQETSMHIEMRDATFPVGRDEIGLVLIPTAALRELQRDAALRGTLPLPGGEVQP